MWAEQTKALQGYAYPILAPNLLGFSRLEDAAQQVLAELGQRGWERAIFVGISLGGYTIFRLWELAPERFVGAVLADTKASPDTPEAKLVRADQAARVLAEGMGFFPEATLKGHLGATTHASRPEVLEQVRQMQLAAQPQKVAYSLEAIAERPNSVPLLSGMDIPALVMVGEEDTLTPLADAEFMAHHLPQSRLVVVPQAGHLSNLENPRAFNKALLDWLKTVDG